MTMKKKDAIKELALHVLIEQVSDGFRAHCLEFDIVVSGKNEEQAMVRMEHSLDVHLNYAFNEKSNPVHFAPEERWRKWATQVRSAGGKSFIMILDQSAKPGSSRRKRSESQSRTFHRYEQNFSLLEHA